MRLARTSVLLGAFVVAACDTGEASPFPGPGSGGSTADAGTGGRAGSAGSGGRGSIDEDAGNPEDSGDGEPSLPKRVTLLHGLTDSPWIGFCFARVEDGVEGELAPDIVPPSGLEYGHSVSLDSLPGVEIGRDAVRPYLVAAKSAEFVRGLDCAAIARLTRVPVPDAGVPGVPDASVTIDSGVVVLDAGTSGDAGDGATDSAPPPPPPVTDVRMTGLPVLAAAALSADSSYLVSVFGCMGGVGVTHPAELSICGGDYAPDRPTLSESVVRLSRITDDGAVGLQFLVGTPAFGRADLALIPGFGGDIVQVASGVGVGALRPLTPFFGATAFEIRAQAEAARLRVYSEGSSLAAYDRPWTDTLAAGELDDLEDGHGYTLALLGPTPGFGAALWWNGPLVAVVKNAD